MTVVVHHDEIRRRIKPRYTTDEGHNLLAFLNVHRTLRFDALPTGLYPAAGVDAAMATRSGYGNVWVRDNVYVALACETAGRPDAARRVAEAIAAFYRKYRRRFEEIIHGEADPALSMNRPQVRFEGNTLSEIPDRWAHAQNDALGYFLWLYCRLAASDDSMTPDGELLGLFVSYFRTIRYWEDEDSGHWEETRKIQASSIGAVVAGLRALQALLRTRGSIAQQRGARVLDADELAPLIAAGERALENILPAECIQPDPSKYRRYDAALLFLIYPLDVVHDAMAQRIVCEVLENLQGEFGIRRYLGDSYWTADYKDKVPAHERTADVSERQEERDALARPGEEAQWCIFDPIVSVIAGRRYLRTGDPADLERQTHHLNRALGQLTGPECRQGELLCPEAYYLEHDRYVPNDHVPLLWTQANLRLALDAMQRSINHGDRSEGR